MPNVMVEASLAACRDARYPTKDCQLELWLNTISADKMASMIAGGGESTITTDATVFVQSVRSVWFLHGMLVFSLSRRGSFFVFSVHDLVIGYPWGIFVLVDSAAGTSRQ